MAESDDLYAQLGLSSSATTVEIAQSYAALVAANAADPESLLRLTHAFQVLGNPSSRTEYDRLRTGPPASIPQPDDSNFGKAAPAAAAIEATTMVETTSPAPGAISEPANAAGPAPVFGATVLPGGPAGAVSAAPVPGPPGDVTQRPATVICPICGANNISALDPTTNFCQDCGFLLSQTPGEGPDAGLAAGPRLVSADGTREFALQEGVNTVGRQDADVLLSDTTVSRLHARVHRTGDNVEVEDANSTNGTKVNGIRLDGGVRTKVGEGDDVQFGQVALKLKGAAPAGAGPTGTIVETGPRPPAASEMPAPEGPPVARLVALTGGQEYFLYAFPARVGRRPDSAVLISDPYVSGLHAEFVEEDGAVLLRDLGSTNGTVVGSEPLPGGSSAPVAAGTIITFGKQRFRYETPVKGPDGSLIWQSVSPEAAVPSESVPGAGPESPAAESGGENAPGDNAAGENAPGENAPGGEVVQSGEVSQASSASDPTGRGAYEAANEPGGSDSDPVASNGGPKVAGVPPE